MLAWAGSCAHEQCSRQAYIFNTACGTLTTSTNERYRWRLLLCPRKCTDLFTAHTHNSLVEVERSVIIACSLQSGCIFFDAHRPFTAAINRIESWSKVCLSHAAQQHRCISLRSNHRWIADSEAVYVVLTRTKDSDSNCNSWVFISLNPTTVMTFTNTFELFVGLVFARNSSIWF